jgi:hypothetical protein
VNAPVDFWNEKNRQTSHPKLIGGCYYDYCFEVPDLHNTPELDTNPVVLRRNEIVKRLEERKLLATDPNHVKVIKTKAGEKQQKIRPMWKPLEDGSLAFFLNVGFKPIEWAPGKTAIAVKALSDLPAVIDTLIAAVRNGELDSKLMVKKTAKKNAA